MTGRGRSARGAYPRKLTVVPLPVPGWKGKEVEDITGEVLRQGEWAKEVQDMIEEAGAIRRTVAAVGVGRGEPMGVRDGRSKGEVERLEEERKKVKQELREARQLVEESRRELMKERREWEEGRRRRQRQAEVLLNKMEAERLASFREGLRQRERTWLGDVRRKLMRDEGVAKKANGDDRKSGTSVQGHVILPDPCQSVVMQTGDRATCPGIFMPFKQLKAE